MTSENDASPMLEALKYEAPFVIEKLLKEQIAETHDEARALFTEVKRYIVLAQVDSTAPWKMYSLRVDEAWHQFVLFTREYTDFCQRFFNRYIHHNPSNAPRMTTESAGKASSFEGFRDHYEALFKVPLPDVWHDERSVTPKRRVINHDAGNWTLRETGGMIDLLDANGELRLSVNEFARDAIAFITCTGAFYVRELPGELSEEEKVAIVATLVQYRLLRVAP